MPGTIADSFDLTVFDDGAAYIAATARHGQSVAMERLDRQVLAGLIADGKEIAKSAAGEATPLTKAVLERYGANLYAMCMVGSIQSIYQRLDPNTRIRIQLLSDSGDVLSLPWEYFKDPVSQFGPNSVRSIQRIIPSVGHSFQPVAKNGGAMKVLFVYADPTDKDPLDWAGQEAQIRNTLEKRFGSAAVIDVIPGADIMHIQRTLKRGEYHVLHFAGHGQVNKAGEGELVLYDTVNRSQSQPCTGEKFGSFLRGLPNLQVVLLSACESSAGNFSRAYAVVAAALVRSGVPAVVAHQFPVQLSIAGTFSAAFYQELFTTGDVDEAVNEGRRALYAGSSAGVEPSELSWGVPTLYRHIGATKLF